MKNVKILKGLLIIVLSLFIVFSYSNMVFAEDDGLFEFEPVEEETAANNSTTEPAANNSADNGLASIDTPSNTANNTVTNNTSISTTNNNTSLNTNTANTLADTGLSDTGSIVAIVLVICGISAVYSYKKVSDYRKL